MPKSIRIFGRRHVLTPHDFLHVGPLLIEYASFAWQVSFGRHGKAFTREDKPRDCARQFEANLISEVMVAKHFLNEVQEMYPDLAGMTVEQLRARLQAMQAA